METLHVKQDVDEKIIPPKKKRGRKPNEKKIVKPSSPKKRGRKPKSRHPEELLPKIPKKRGRKPKDKYGLIPKKNHICKKIVNEEQVILHLSITSDEIRKEEEYGSSLFTYNPNISEPVPYENENNNNNLSNLSPYPFDKQKNVEIKSQNNNENHFFEKEENDILDIGENVENLENVIIKKLRYEGIQNIINQDKKKEIINIKLKKKEINIKYNKTVLKNKTMKIEQNFNSDTNDNNYWPKATNIACWWCSYNFDNTPATLPIKYEKGVYFVTGIFCSPECGASWNFNQNVSDTLIWKRYSLLNMLYINMYKNVNLNIKLAPSKELLEKFGGNLSIEEFRKSCNNYGRDFKLIMPPVKSIVHSVNEEANIMVKNKIKKFIPIDKERIKKANEELKLKRNKPLTNRNNTLENCMNLTRM
jgi:hypothetical protein